METAPLTLRLDQLPLWRLLVALADAERVAGPDSPTARALAREINHRLTGPNPSDAAGAPNPKGGGRG